MGAIEIIEKNILSDTKYKLEEVKFTQPGQNDKIQQKIVEVYFRPDVCSILLINRESSLVLLTEQYRVPTYLNGNSSGLIVEACAGIIDNGELPEQCAVREVEEETGYRISEIKKVFEAYSSPGGITEKVYFFIGFYSDEMKISAGGGLENEQENIKIVQVSFSKIRDMLDRGEVHDCKTILLLQHAIIHRLI